MAERRGAATGSGGGATGSPVVGGRPGRLATGSGVAGVGGLDVARPVGLEEVPLLGARRMKVSNSRATCWVTRAMSTRRRPVRVRSTGGPMTAVWSLPGPL